MLAVLGDSGGPECMDFTKRTTMINTTTTAIIALASPDLWSSRPTKNSAHYSCLVYSVGISSLASQKIEHDPMHSEAPLLLYNNLPILVEMFPSCFLQVRGCFSFTSTRPYRLREGGISRELQHRRIRNLGYRVLFEWNHSIR